MITNRTVAAILSVTLSLSTPARAGFDGPDDEVERHLSKLRPRLEDRSISAAERAGLAMEMASTLDRAAQGETKPERKRARWLAAAELLEEFNAENPTHPKARGFALQSSVYRWARARSWLARLEIEPTDANARETAIVELDKVLRNLNQLYERNPDGQDEVSQNLRFRLAQALADRASLEDATSLEGRRSEERAVLLLERPPIRLDSLLGFAHWLRADLLTRLNRLNDALPAIEAAERARYMPSESSVLALKVKILEGLKRYDEASEAIRRAKIGETERSLLALRVALGRRAGSPETDTRRGEAEAEAFERLEILKKMNAPEARTALLDLARAIDEPNPKAKPESFETLADGRFLLGDSDKAIRLMLEGATQAEKANRLKLAGRLRYRAAAFLFQKEDFAQCDQVLTKLVADPIYGDVRPRASLLRILARERSALPGQDEARRAYIDSLTTHLRDFPADPTSGEARWRLGKASMLSGRRKEAFSLWNAVSRDSSRWLESRLAILETLREEIAADWKRGDQAEAERLKREAQTKSEETRTHCRDAAERFALELAKARLNLIPGIGNPRLALDDCERLRGAPGRLSQRVQAEHLRIVALALNRRFRDADFAASPVKGKLSPADALDMARLLDRAAEGIESDADRRRCGQLMTDLLAPLDSLPTDPAAANLRDEFFLRRTRGLAFAGATESAWKILMSWNPDQEKLDDPRLEVLADLEIRLGAFDRAVSTYRLLIQRRRTGSSAWLDARYGLALAYDRSGRGIEAMKLIRATELLHPDFGGGAIKTRFERLKREIERK